jgi:hypothetical protein
MKWLHTFGAWLFSAWLFSACAASISKVTLAWDPPTNNTDGTTLIDLAGYKLYWGSSSRGYTHSNDVGNVTEYTITNITSLDRFFAVTAYSTNGNTSEFSKELRFFAYDVRYANETFITVEAEDVILDPPMGVFLDFDTHYIRNTNGSTANANFSFVYRFTNSPSTNQFYIWYRTKSTSGSGNFAINCISEVDKIPLTNVVSTTNNWSITTLSTNIWHWEQLKQNSIPVAIPVYLNTIQTYVFSLSNDYTLLDKILFTPSTNYIPFEAPIPYLTPSYGSEFTMATNSVMLSWASVLGASSYKVYGTWSDPSSGQQYSYGTTYNNSMLVPMSRTGHFFYRIDAYSGTNKIQTLRSDIPNNALYVYGYYSNTPWKIFWKVPPPTGIIIE